MSGTGCDCNRRASSSASAAAERTPDIPEVLPPKPFTCRTPDMLGTDDTPEMLPGLGVRTLGSDGTLGSDPPPGLDPGDERTPLALGFDSDDVRERILRSPSVGVNSWI